MEEASNFLCESELFKEDWDSISELGFFKRFQMVNGTNKLLCLGIYIQYRTKVFVHHRNLHTNNIKVDLFIKEYVLKLLEILYF